MARRAGDCLRILFVSLFMVLDALCIIVILDVTPSGRGIGLISLFGI